MSVYRLSHKPASSFPTPDNFSRDVSKCGGFLLQCSLAFARSPHFFRILAAVTGHCGAHKCFQRANEGPVGIMKGAILSPWLSESTTGWPNRGGRRCPAANNLLFGGLLLTCSTFLLPGSPLRLESRLQRIPQMVGRAHSGRTSSAFESQRMSLLWCQESFHCNLPRLAKR